MTIIICDPDGNSIAGIALMEMAVIGTNGAGRHADETVHYYRIEPADDEAIRPYMPPALPPSLPDGVDGPFHNEPISRRIPRTHHPKSAPATNSANTTNAISRRLRVAR